jgi:hypothetical protein
MSTGEADGGGDAVLGYDDLQVGGTYRSTELTVTPDLMNAWAELTGEQGNGALPAAAWSVIVMPAVIAGVGPRPDGNIHARQNLRIYRMPRVGETITARVRVEDKYERRGRLYVLQSVSVFAAREELLLEASTLTVWPRI